MLINGLTIAQRIEIIKPISEASLCSLKSTSSNTRTTSLDTSEDNTVVISDIGKKYHNSHDNVILAPLKITHVNKVANIRS